jgi:hypothetical protein
MPFVGSSEISNAEQERVTVKMSPLLVCVMLLMAGAAAAAAEMRQACDATVDVTDTDPAGTHVRSAPGGPIIATLSNPGDGWITVHLKAQLGDWYEINAASLVDPTHLGTLFHGKGYVHKSMLGVSGMQNGGTLYIDHDGKRRSFRMLPATSPCFFWAAGARSSK